MEKKLSIDEARKTSQIDGLDPRTGDLIEWLCDEVERLQALMNVKPVNKETILFDKSLLGHLFITAFTQAFLKIQDPVSGNVKKLVEAKELSMVLLVNGVPMDAAAVCVEWEKQVDWMVNKKAEELLLDKFGKSRNQIADLMASVEEHLKDKMREAGIKDNNEQE